MEKKQKVYGLLKKIYGHLNWHIIISNMQYEYDYLDLFVHMKHLLCFSNFEIGCYVNSPIFEHFVEFTKSNVSQLNETSLNIIQKIDVLDLAISYGPYYMANRLLLHWVLKRLTTIVIIENRHIARITKVFDFGLSI